MPSSRCAVSIASTASPSDAPGARLNDIVTAGNCPAWLITSGVLRSSMRAMLAQRHLLPVGRGDVDLSQRVGSELVPRRHFEHDAVLVRLRVDGRDQPLPERVVERVVDGRHADAEAARGIAVDVHERLQPAVLQVAGDVGELRRLLEPRQATSAPTRRVASASGSSSVNWNCVRLTRSSMVRSCTGCMYSVMPGTGRTRSCSAAMISVALRDAVRAAPAIPASARCSASRWLPSTPMNDDRPVDVGFLQDFLRGAPLAIGHRRERHRLRRLGDHLDGARILHREEALRARRCTAMRSAPSWPSATIRVTVS